MQIILLLCKADGMIFHPIHFCFLQPLILCYNMNIAWNGIAKSPIRLVKTVIQIDSIEELHRFQKQDGIAILEVASRTCAPCIRIRQKIDEWLKNYAAVSAAYIEIESVPEAGGALQIFTAPAVLVYIDGKLCIKQAGYFSLDEVFRQIERYLSLM